MTSSPETQFETQLIELTNRFRSSRGAAALTDRGLLSAYLLGEAPQLRPYIGALTAALAGGRVWQPREVATTAQINEMAGEISAAEKVDAALAVTAIRAALRIAQPGLTIETAPAPAAQPAAQPIPDIAPQPRGGWVGETVVAGTPPAPPPPPPPAGPAGLNTTPAASPAGPAKGSLGEVSQLIQRKDWAGLLRNRWVLGALAVLAVIVFMDDSSEPPPQQNQPQAQPQQPPQQPPRQQGPDGQTPPPRQSAQPAQGGPSMPRLVDPNQGALPRLAYKENQGSHFVGFSLPSQQGDLIGMVMVPAQGWDSGALVYFHREGAQQPETASTPGQAQLHTDQQGAARVLQPKWQVDRLGIKDICIGFHQQRAQDVTLNGSTLCVYGADCSRTIGCGLVP